MKRALERLADLDNPINDHGNDSRGDSTSSNSESFGDDDGSISSSSSSSDESFHSSLGYATTGNLRKKSCTDGTTSFINPDTMAAAAAIMARDQSNRRRPILLGSNTDGTINVQLPTGTVIAVEATAFPEYNRAAASVALTKASVSGGDSELKFDVTCSSTGTGSSNPTAHHSVIDATSGDDAKQKQPPQPLAVAQERATSKATIEEIERALPAAASCVFHIFDRRVNLDAHSGRPFDTYSLLRAWAQDDPYRYNEPAPDHPPTSSSTPWVLPVAKMRDETTLRWQGSSRLQPSISTISSSDKECVKEPETKTTDYVEQIKATSSSSKAPPTIEDLRGLLVQQAKTIRKQKAPKFQRCDADVIRRFRERVFDIGTY